MPLGQLLLKMHLWGMCVEGIYGGGWGHLGSLHPVSLTLCA